jgi:hypothetical protein
MSFLAYQTLDDVGVKLPKLTEAKLAIETNTLSESEVISVIDDFIPVQGWIQYRNETILSTVTPNRTDIIEAQYCDSKKNSLHIKLVQNNKYLITKFSHTIDSNNPQVYSEQLIELRTNLKSSEQNIENAIYRLWWQQESIGLDEGRWQPFVQQFIGFDIKGKKRRIINE